VAEAIDFLDFYAREALRLGGPQPVVQVAGERNALYYIPLSMRIDGDVTFEGDLILGHEMHLDATVDCLLRYNLRFAYFCETRHQKGDWFIAKRLAPRGQVALAHYFTPAAMVPEDYHSAAHHWGMLARARGIRLCYVNVFRRIHATDPLECLHYLDHLKGELQGLGLVLHPEADALAPTQRQRLAAQRSGEAAAPAVLPAPDRRTLALAALAPAGAAALAAASALRLPEPVAMALTALSVAGAAALPFYDRPRGRLEEAYPPSYAPKLLALAAAAAAPVAAAALSNGTLVGLASAVLAQGGTATALALFTSGQDYQMRVEQFRSLNLDWALPLGAALLAQQRWRKLSEGGVMTEGEKQLA